VSLQYTLAEALHFGELGKNAYQPASLRNPEILRLADLVTYQVDPAFPGPERFKGAIRVVMKDGTVYEAIEEHNRGSAANPMTRDELVGKFETNAEDVLTQPERARLIEAVSGLDSSPDAGTLAQLSVAGAAAHAK
jgi:2-methylcitrate dehydratase PrpD